MLTAQIVQNVCSRIDEQDPANPISVSDNLILNAVNEGQLFASFLTLFLVKTASFALSGLAFYNPRQILPDFLVPLRLSVGGIRLRPSTLTELDGWNGAWQATAGPPARYATIGSNLLAVTPQSAASMLFTYAASPPLMVLTPGDVLVIPPAYHQSLVEYGIYRVRLKEGAQQLARGLTNLNTYLNAMQELGDWVRNRSKAAAYDVEPIEMQTLDRSKLIDDILKRQAKRAAAGITK